MQRRRFDLALRCQGSGLLSNPFTAMLGTGCTDRFHPPGQYCPDPAGFLAWDGYGPEPARYVRLVEHLGFRSSGVNLDFPVGDADRDALARAGPGLGGSYACLHPAPSTPPVDGH